MQEGLDGLPLERRLGRVEPERLEVAARGLLDLSVERGLRGGLRRIARAVEEVFGFGLQEGELPQVVGLGEL